MDDASPLDTPPQIDYRAFPNVGEVAADPAYQIAASYDDPIEGRPVRPPDDADIHAYDLPDRPGIDRSLVQPTLDGFTPDLPSILAWERKTNA